VIPSELVEDQSSLRSNPNAKATASGFVIIVAKGTPFLLSRELGRGTHPNAKLRPAAGLQFFLLQAQPDSGFPGFKIAHLASREVCVKEDQE
jgi:hypothetical protein